MTSDLSVLAATGDVPAAEGDPLHASKFAVPEAPPFWCCDAASSTGSPTPSISP